MSTGKHDWYSGAIYRAVSVLTKSVAVRKYRCDHTVVVLQALSVRYLNVHKKLSQHDETETEAEA